MRRLISVIAAGSLVLALGVGGALAAPNSHAASASQSLGHGRIFRVHVSPVVWAGGRIGFTATFSNCGRDASTATVVVTSLGGLTTDASGGTVTLKRVNNAHAKACVWRGAANVVSGSDGTSYKIDFTYTKGATTLSKSAWTRFVDHTTGSDTSSGS